MDLPDDQQIYRHWIELRDLRTGSVRVMPLQAFKRIHLPTKRGAPQLPDEMVLRVDDGAETIEAPNIDGLAAQLRARYPDETFERFLRCERDVEAEKRKAQAMTRLIEILAKTALDNLMNEQAGPGGNQSPREPDSDTILRR